MVRPVFLKNGEQVKVNDHVYCSPSWAIRDGTPYSIGRIMEFLPPEAAPKGEEGENYLYTRVRLAWYYRPGDVTDRNVVDSRVLLAAIFSEICDINQLRAKCHVVHRDKISDLAGWKKRPDRFYFNRLFDPYVKKEFEIIQASDVRNLPDHIRQTLISRYEYVVAEKEVIPDLTDAIRLCDSCQEWCSNPDAVPCDRCKRFFHMLCVQPPLSAKPPRGYGWTCAPCARRHEQEVDSHDIRHTTPVPALKPNKSNAPAPRGRGRPRKDKTQAEKEENLAIRHFKMWPFRYFGQHTVAEDTLDPDDLIFPRTATRLGPKYQANVPAAPELDINPSEPDERGGDNTIEILGIINTLTEAEVSEVEAWKQELTQDIKIQSSVDWITEVIRRFSDVALAAKASNSVNMKSPMRLEKWKKYETPFTDKEWSREEVAAFEDALFMHGAELRAVREEVGTRSMPEVVRFYGLWKSAKVGEENLRKSKQGVRPKLFLKQFPNKELAKSGQRVGLTDGESSVIAHPSKPPCCAGCRTRESTIWWKAPKGLSTNVMCDACGTNWRKYADLVVRPLRDDSVAPGKPKASEKREGTPLNGTSSKRSRTSSAQLSSSPPASILSQLMCTACKKVGQIGKVLQCKKCQFRVHAGVCGAVFDLTRTESWTCDLCLNEETLEASVDSDCLLCPRSSSSQKKHRPLGNPNCFLRACKPTEGHGWIHVLCAVFTPELTFSDASRLRLVEGVSIIPQHRWTAKCDLCNFSRGSCIRCVDCCKEFHVSCAWSSGRRFGFEIQQVKSSRRDATVLATFKGETGSMTPVVQCVEHDQLKRHIHEMCELGENGETALQVYCQAYKQASVGHSHALLRKARRLDQILNIRNDSVIIPPSAVDPECSQCHSQYSPTFYPNSKSSPVTWICHQCHFKANDPLRVQNNSY